MGENIYTCWSSDVKMKEKGELHYQENTQIPTYLRQDTRVNVRLTSQTDVCFELF